MSCDRRRFLRTGAGVAAGALGLTYSTGSKSAGAALAAAAAQLPIEGEMGSLRHAVGWLNSRPLEVADLRGKVVLVTFWTYTCINSLRTLPYVRAWAERYKGQGLVVIGVHTPEFSFEHDPSNVRRMTKEIQLAYPIAIDSDYAIWRAFRNEYWPAFYFVDAKGRIRHHQFGEGEYDRSESVIQEMLREAGASGVSREPMAVSGRGIEAAPDWGALQSPETYVGKAQAQNFAGLRKANAQSTRFELKLNHWALEGDWMWGEEAAVLRESGGRVVYCFHARDLHLVMAPAASGAAVRFRVTLDGQTPGAAHGLDVNSEGEGTVSEPRLYQLVRQKQPLGDRRFEITFLDAGAQVFDFTFG